MHFQNNKNESEKHVKNNIKMSEIEPPIETKKLIFQTSASKTLWWFTGYYFSDHKSPHCSESTSFKAFNEKPCTATPTPIEVLENVTFQQIWPRLAIWEHGSGPGFRPRAGPRL